MTEQDLLELEQEIAAEMQARDAAMQRAQDLARQQQAAIAEASAHNGAAEALIRQHQKYKARAASAGANAETPGSA